MNVYIVYTKNSRYSVVKPNDSIRLKDKSEVITLPNNYIYIYGKQSHSKQFNIVIYQRNKN